MTTVYSVYEAKAKFSEIIRKVRGGKRVVIACRGQHVAELRPIPKSEETLDVRLRRLEAEGALIGTETDRGTLRTIVRKAGALSRFLGSREWGLRTSILPVWLPSGLVSRLDERSAGGWRASSACSRRTSSKQSCERPLHEKGPGKQARRSCCGRSRGYCQTALLPWSSSARLRSAHSRAPICGI